MESGPQCGLNIGDTVQASDGAELGTVAFVVVHPPELQVTHLVVSTGDWLGRDLVVPLNEVESSSEGRVRLTIDRAGLEGHEDYVEVHFAQPPDNWSMPGFPYAGSGVLGPAGSYFPQVSDVTVHTPTGSVGLSEGMDVRSSDDHHIGSIHRLETDSTGTSISALVVQHGVFFKHDTAIPVAEVAETRSDSVVLRLTQDQARERFEAEQT